jgi:hypothetical protein
MRFLLAATLWLALAVAPLAAQNPAPTPQQPEAKESSSGSPMPWVVGVLCTLAILLIVCMPSRKSQS